MGFDIPAEAYDRFMGRYSSLLSAQFADFAGVQPGQRALDVGCGPDDSVDVALAQLVIHFMSDPAAGLSEMGRVVRSGGVVAANGWDFVGELFTAVGLLDVSEVALEISMEHSDFEEWWVPYTGGVGPVGDGIVG